jgi:hypothetical protein
VVTKLGRGSCWECCASGGLKLKKWVTKAPLTRVSFGPKEELAAANTTNVKTIIPATNIGESYEINLPSLSNHSRNNLFKSFTVKTFRKANKLLIDTMCNATELTQATIVRHAMHPPLQLCAPVEQNELHSEFRHQSFGGIRI